MNTWEGSEIKRKNGIQYVNDDKGDHQHQDAVGGSGLWGASVVPSEGCEHTAPSGGVCAEAPWSHWTGPWGQETRHQRWTTSRQSHQQDLRISKTTLLGYQYSCVCSVEQRFSEEQWCTLRDWTSSRCSRKDQWPWGPFLWASSTLLSSGWEWRTDRFSGRRWSTGRCWEPLSVSNTEFTSKTRQGALWHKSCHCVENAKSEKNQDTGHGHVGENHVCGYLLVAKQDWRDAVEEKDGIDQSPNHRL